MKIGIDVSPVVYETGTSYYTLRLVENLLIQAKQDDFVLFGYSLRAYSKLVAKLANLTSKNASVSTFHFPPGLMEVVWNRLHVVPVETLIGQVDVFHSSDWIAPVTRCPIVTTVHDLTPIKFPSQTHPKIVDVHKRRLQWVAKEAKAVIVPSQATKADLIDYGIKPEIIHVIFEARAIDLTASQADVVDTKRSFRIDGDYVLSVGGAERKNIPRVIEAMSRVRKSFKLDLVVVGRQERPMKAPEWVHFVGHVQSKALAALYKGAQILVYPSLYEGFGLPILEGFEAGIPVVTSDLSAMSEIAGDSAILVDPTSEERIALGILTAMKNSDDLIRKGAARAKQFSWQTAARQTLAVYRLFC